MCLPVSYNSITKFLALVVRKGWDAGGDQINCWAWMWTFTAAIFSFFLFQFPCFIFGSDTQSETWLYNHNHSQNVSNACKLTLTCYQGYQNLLDYIKKRICKKLKDLVQRLWVFFPLSPKLKPKSTSWDPVDIWFWLQLRVNQAAELPPTWVNGSWPAERISLKVRD